MTRQDKENRATPRAAGSGRTSFNRLFARALIVCLLGVLGASSWVRPGETQQSGGPAGPPRQTGQDYRLRVGGYDFDPLRGEPQIREELKALRRTGQAAYHIVQFNKSLTRAERERLQRSYGLRLSAYIPNLAYLEKLSEQALSGLSREPNFRASVPYHPAFKISPTLGQVAPRSARRRALNGLLLFAVLFPEADPANVVAAVREAKRRENGAGDRPAPAPARVATPDAQRPGTRTPTVRLPEYPSDIRETKIIDERKVGGQFRVRFFLRSQQSVARIAQQEEVRWIEEVPEVNFDNGNTAGTIQSGAPGTTPVWDQGIHGEGQTVGVLDSILDFNHCMFQDPADNTVRPAHRKVVGFRNPNGEADDAHGTFVSGIVAGDDFNNLGTGANRGMAWAARLTFGTNTDVFFGNASMLTALATAAADGASIHTNSWHQEPEAYNQTNVDVDQFVWDNEDHFVLGSSGNVGESIGPPGTAKNALCVSATQGDPNEMTFGDGNTGPSIDGRRKPEIFAPGCAITSAQVGTACTITLDSVIYGGPVCATSWATPATAGTAALVRQYYTEGWYPSGTRQPHNSFTPSGALIKATLLNSTIDMTGIAGYPGTQEGWGLMRLNNTLFFPGSARNLRVWDTRRASGLTTGTSQTHTITVTSNAQPLKITLVWSDPPAAAGTTGQALVNDLNLVAVSPDGTQTFIGNDFVAGVTPANSGTAADGLNNVEMVLVNTPAAGTWTIRVDAPTVNVGEQGYALVATADLTEPPPVSGSQDTLVVRVNFNDISFTPPLPNLQNKIDDAVDYIDEVSYGKTTIAPDYVGPVTLDNGRNFYYHPSRNLLIEMTEEVVAKLIAANADTFTKGTADPADDIDRLILVTNDEDFTDDWATTGPWPYDLPGGFTRPISVSVQSFDNNLARFAHGLGHQFGLVDLYAHPGVTFSRPSYADLWDNMAKPFRTVHYLTWEKERAGWINTPTNQITYIPRPAAGASYTGTNPIPLFFQESTATNNKAIALGTTNGAATLGAEDVFYFVEAREKVAGSFDNDLPTSGVLIYFVNERIPQGQGPVILLDKTPGTDGLEDAAFQVGDSRMIPGTGITITVQAGTGGAAFNIQVAYAPPNNDYNVRITKGDTLDGQFYPYFSSDVWVDSPKNGIGNLAGGPPPNDQIENPVVNMVNNLCARVSNDGPGIAFDFDVRFRVSEPFQTVGGEPDFDQLVATKRIVGLVPAGQPVPASPAGMVSSPAIVCVPWTPLNDGDPHSCLLVDFINLVGTDTNQFDNEAQENLQEVTSVTMSPFHPVTYPYELTNPYDQPALFYFRAEGAPPGWSVVLNPKKALLNPGQRVGGFATVTPPPDAQVCTSERIQITSWTPQGDTLINVGGAVAKVNLRRNTLLTLDTRVEKCRRRDEPNKPPPPPPVIGSQPFGSLVFAFQPLSLSLAPPAPPAPAAPQTLRRECERIVARGCTNPALPNQLIVVKYVEPDGTPVYHQVMTDAMGCYEDFLVTTKEGEWKVTAEYEGDKCQGPTTGGPRRWKCCVPIR